MEKINHTFNSIIGYGTLKASNFSLAKIVNNLLVLVYTYILNTFCFVGGHCVMANRNWSFPWAVNLLNWKWGQSKFSINMRVDPTSQRFFQPDKKYSFRNLEGLKQGYFWVLVVGWQRLGIIPRTVILTDGHQDLWKHPGRNRRFQRTIVDRNLSASAVSDSDVQENKNPSYPRPLNLLMCADISTDTKIQNL